MSELEKIVAVQEKAQVIGEFLDYDTKYVLEPFANSVTINWVWLPPWSLEMITDDGREQLRSIGYNL